ncbi:MAG: hypothetical protein ACLT0R_15650 [Paraclostridium sordellii]|uniref:hypothetical protein n=1 Tax=Paraclostridium sordellii TaxID=1505 RepID=UPI0005E7F57A|nr:hypothetical protein [Paeniclostridium sordellii]CEP43529.1 Uncharacterised protein [[Clostridium] sordellii] [Paeniclostridium sordellii]
MNELKFEDLQEVNGGGWREAGEAFVATVKLGATPFVLPRGPIAVGNHIKKQWAHIQHASENAYK